MNTVFFLSSPSILPSCGAQKSHYSFQLYGHPHRVPSLSLHSLRLHTPPPPPQSTPSNEAQGQGQGVVSVINFEDFVEKDWSFLDYDEINSEEERNVKANRIIAAGGMGDKSRVLVSICPEDFVDRLVETSPCDLLLVVHDSLFALACIKEKYDKVKCWQGELIYVPDKWTSFDVVFLYYLPALPFELAQVFEALAQRCSPGARVVISHPQGRAGADHQRQQYPDVVTSDMPNKIDLQKAATDHCFKIAEFVDEPDFYLAVLNYCKE